MCQKKEKPHKCDTFEKRRHINAKPYKREKSKIDYDVDDDNYSY